MYPHFIEVYEKEMDGKVIVNIDNITMVCGDENAEILIKGYSNETSFVECKESYSDVKKLIEDSGALINMSDPRLDINAPLRMEELKDMIGEPVWNSNKMEWHIVQEIAKWDDSRGKEVVVLQSKGNIHWYYDTEELIKYPLYRMKRDGDRMYIPDGYTQAKTGDKNHE